MKKPSMTKLRLLLTILIITGANLAIAGTPPYIAGLGSITGLKGELLNAGYMDVTLYDGWVDPNGTTRRVDPNPNDGNWHDSTKAIQKALDDAHDYDLVAWFPAGTYKITDTLGAFQYSLTDKPDEKSCTIIGEGPGLVTLTLPSHAPKFDNVNALRAMLVFKHFTRNSSSNANMVQLSQKHNGSYPPYDGKNSPPGFTSKASVLFHSEIRNINFDLGGHDGALGLYMCAAQDTSMENIHVDANGAYGGIWGLPGRNAGAANISVDGGRYGLYLKDFPGNDAMLQPMVVGLTLTDQTSASIFYVDPSPLVIAGFKIEKNNGSIITINSSSVTATGTVIFVDGSIKVNSGTAINNNAGKNIYMRNVYVTGTNTIVNNGGGVTLTGSGSWKRVIEYSYTSQTNVGNYTNGTTKFKSYNLINGSVNRTKEVLGKNVQNNSGAPPADLVSRHVWSSLPDFLGTADGTKNIMKAPYNATRNNTSNDAVAIQNAIDAASAAGHGRVFIPTGTFLIDRTINLRHNTVLWGAGRGLTFIKCHSSWRPTSGEPAMFRTDNNANATTFLGFLTIETKNNGGAGSGKPYNQTADAYDRFTGLHWRAGRNSMSVAVEIAKEWKLGKEQKTNAHSTIKFTGAGGGRHYFLMPSNKDYADNHPDYRKVLISGTYEPLWYYGLNVEHSESDAEVEIVNSSNIRIYGTKNEVGGLFNNFTNNWGTIPSILIRDSNNIALFGGGALRHAPSTHPADRGIFVVRGNSDDILMTCLIPHKAENANFNPKGPMLSEDLSSSSKIDINWPDAVSLYKRGNLDDSVMVLSGGGGPPPPPPPVTDSIAFSETPPTAIEQGQSYDIKVDWSSAGNYVVEVVLLRSVSPYEIFSDVVTKSVSSGQSGSSENFRVTVNSNASTEANACRWRVRLLDGGNTVVPNVVVQNVTVSAPAVMDSIAFSQTPPAVVEQGQSYDIAVDWASAGNYTVEVLLLESSSPYTILSDVVTKSVSAGQWSNGDVFRVTVNSDAITTANACRWRIRLLNGGSTVVPNVVVQNVTVNPPPIADAIAFSQTPPTVITQGGTYNINVDWASSGNCVVEVALLLNTDPYSIHSNVVTKNVSAGQSAINDSFTVNVHNNAPSPCRWRIRLLNEFGGTVLPNVVKTNVSVNSGNLPPAVSPIGDRTVAEGASAVIGISASDPNGDALVLSGSGLPGFANFVDNGNGTGSINVNPGFNNAGNYNITVNAYDGSFVGSSSFTLNVTPTNRNPTVNAIADLTVQETKAGSVSFSGSDPDGDSISFTATGVPSFGNFTDNGNGTGSIQFNPGYTDTGSYPITVNASDGNGGSVGQSFTLTVNNMNRAATFTAISDQTVEVGASVNILVMVSDPDADDTLVISASGLPGFASLTDNGNRTATITASPTAGAEGSYPISVSVDDSWPFPGIVTTSFTLNVVPPPNTAPVLDPIADLTVQETKTGSVALSASDADGDTLSLSVSGLPSFGTFTDGGNGSGAIDFSPGYSDLGSYPINVSVDDGNGGSASQSFTLTVNNMNRAGSLNLIADQTVEEGQSLTVSVVASDPDADDTLVLSATGLPSFASINDNGDGTANISVSPAIGDAGTYTVTVNLDDSWPVPGTITTSFSLDVTPANRAPTVDSIADQTVPEGQSISVFVSAVDLDGDTLILSASGLPTFASFVDNGDGSGDINISPGWTDAGSHAVTVSADDGELTGFTNFTLDITPANAPPQMSPIADATIKENGTVTVTYGGSDADGDALSLSVSGLPAFGSETDNGDGTGSILFTPGYDDMGVYPISVTIDDGNGGTDVQSFSLTVENENRAVSLGVISGQTLEEEETLSVPISASDPDSDDVIVLSVSGLPPFGSLVDHGDGSGTISVSPAMGDAGSYTLSVSASDGHSTPGDASVNFSIVVTQKNFDPVLSPISAVSIPEGGTGSVALSATDSVGDFLTFNVSGLPAFGTLIDNGDGTGSLDFAPTLLDKGVYPISVTVEDGKGGSAVQSFSLDVSNTNQVTIVNPIPDQSIDTEGVLTINVIAADPDPDDTLYLAAPGLPSFASFTDNGNGTGSVIVQPASGDEGTYSITVNVDDTWPDPGPVSVTFTLTVTTAINVIGETGEQFAAQGSSDEWQTVHFVNVYEDPVVIAGPLSDNDTEPCHVRIRNVTSNSFQFQIEEWDYLDGVHGNEEFCYIVVESGQHTLTDGTVIEAGIASGITDSWADVSFNHTFASPPIVFSGTVSENEVESVVTRQRNITENDFSIRLQEQDTGGSHVAEEVAWIAMEVSSGQSGNILYEVGTADRKVKHTGAPVTLQHSYSEVPVFFASQQTAAGGDSCAVRSSDLSTTGAFVFIEEEQSKDPEVKHVEETVGYAAFQLGDIEAQ